MSRQAPRVLGAVTGQPWAIKPEWLSTIIDLAQRQGQDFDAVQARRGELQNNDLKMRVRDGVAILPVTGPIFPRANLMTEMSGATSLDILATDLQQAMDNDAVKAVLLDIDSPGGVAFGVGEMASMIRAADKPVTAYVSGMGASAAYWLAAAAHEVVVHPTAIVGSIGVVTAAEVQENPDRDGYRHFEIVSSNAPNKRPDMATEEGVEQVRTVLDRLEAEFIAAVAEYRDTAPAVVVSDFGHGDVLVGADAVAAGMADRTGTFEEVLAGMAGGTDTHEGVRQSTQKGTTQMSDKTQKPAAEKQPEITVEILTANHPDVVAALTAPAVEAAHKAGADAERARIEGIEVNALPGHEDLVAQLKADGSTTPDQAAGLIIAAEKQTGKRHLEAIQGDENDAPAPAPVSTALGENGVPDNASLEDKAKAKWDGDADLRAEFGDNFDRFMAYEKAVDSGTVKVLKDRKTG